MEKHQGNNLLFLESGALPFMVDLTFGKILNIREELQQIRYLYSYGSYAKKIHFCERADDCLLKDAEENSYKKPIITPIFKLKALVICTKFDLGRDI